MLTRWLIASVVAGLLMTAGATGAVADTAPLAGRIKPGVTYSGPGTWYDSDGDGACLFGPSADAMTVAMNQTDYEASKACGAYLEVRAFNGRTVRVRVNNLCPSPCRVGQLDLTKEAFARLADPMVGEISVTWKLLSPGMSNGISFRYKDGSSQWWCAIQAIDHRNPVARLEVQTAGGWKQLRRTDYNYFLSEDGAGCGGAVAVTDIYGQRLVSTPLAIRPGAAQPTSLQFAQH
jgi:expansin